MAFAGCLNSRRLQRSVSLGPSRFGVAGFDKGQTFALAFAINMVI